MQRKQNNGGSCRKQISSSVQAFYINIQHEKQAKPTKSFCLNSQCRYYIHLCKKRKEGGLAQLIKLHHLRGDCCVSRKTRETGLLPCIKSSYSDQYTLTVRPKA